MMVKLFQFVVELLDFACVLLNTQLSNYFLLFARKELFFTQIWLLKNQSEEKAVSHMERRVFNK